MDWKTLIFETPIVTRTLSTVVLIVITLAIRSVILRRLAAKEGIDATIRRRWIVTTRNTVFLIVFGIN